MVVTGPVMTGHTASNIVQLRNWFQEAQGAVHSDFLCSVVFLYSLALLVEMNRVEHVNR
jgi:hypothetical protein